MIVCPKIRVVDGEGDSARVIIEPLMPGYGVTFGHALRRALLGLPGQAIVAVRSRATGIREDAMNLLLNLREVRVTGEGVGPWRAAAHLTNVDVVTAGALRGEGVVVVNPDQRIATGADVDVDLEVIIVDGRGYRSADKAYLTDGFIPVEARFTPVIRADVIVENTRVAAAVDYDRLVLEVTVDPGTTVGHVVADAARELSAVFKPAVIHPADAEPVADWRNEVVAERRPMADDHAEVANPTLLEMSIHVLGLSPLTYGKLRRVRITTVADLVGRSRTELLRIRNFGLTSMNDVEACLKQNGLHLASDKI